MVYNSFLFIWLFPIIFMVGNNLTVPYRKYFFLIVSYGIYIYYNKWMTLTLIAVSLISYFFAKYLERNQNKYLEKDLEKDLEKRPGEESRKGPEERPDKEPEKRPGQEELRERNYLRKRNYLCRSHCNHSSACRFQIRALHLGKS